MVAVGPGIQVSLVQTQWEGGQPSTEELLGPNQR